MRRLGWPGRTRNGPATSSMQAKRLVDIQQVLAKDKDQAKPQWYVNGQGQTMVVIPGPVEFLMGSPETEAGRLPGENQHKRRIGRTFALAAKPVTLEQYRKFKARYGIGQIESWARTGDSPVIGMNWYKAAAYCNWLSEQEGLPQSQWCYEPLDPLPALAGSSVGRLAGSSGPLAASSGLSPRRMDPEFKEGMKLAKDHLQAQRLSAADASGDGICLPGRGDHEPLFRPDRRAAGQICLVHTQFPGPNLAGGQQEAQRPGLVRHARQCLVLVSGKI